MGLNGVIVEVDGQEITSDSGPNGWSNASYGEMLGYACQSADAVGLTGQQITSAVPDSLTPEQIVGVSMTSSIGSVLLDQELVG